MAVLERSGWPYPISGVTPHPREQGEGFTPSSGGPAFGARICNRRIEGKGIDRERGGCDHHPAASPTCKLFDFGSFSKRAPEIELFNRQGINLCNFNLL
ncbi:hypothetical protein [Ruixingdingia sedimenti]|uniref:Uncharacterized protein n=1 Tax=Ruixingdingia sedimenti TaxID=3073604 RepID=A0ABU1FDL4_9RHOB|nr:hypothetical protein [Xinfangfangia sp. LG-4]MDR5654994.1 hypothetical protein [Xinfangfangia sp. LG-4]